MAVGATGTPTANFNIPKYATSADAPNGTGFNSAMDYLDTLLLGAPVASKITGLVDEDVPVWDTTTGTWLRAAYTAFTPAWTSTGTAPSLGNAVVFARYMRLGKFVHYAGSIVFGSGSTFGTGNYRFSLPVSAGIVATGRGGLVTGFDASATQQVLGFAYTATASTFAAQYPSAWPTGTPIEYAQTTPFTWASGDSIEWNFMYEAA
jgi:hypothetical protein